jgi:glutaredoxin
VKNELIVYGREDGSCFGCEQAKEFLSANGIQYDMRNISIGDIEKRIQYKKELTALRVNMIPCFVFGDEVLVGFNDESEKRLVEILEISVDTVVR